MQCLHLDCKIHYDVDEVTVRKCADCGEVIIGVTENGITLLETSNNIFQLLADNNIAYHLVEGS